MAPPARALVWLAVAFAVIACDPRLEVPSAVAENIDGAGIQLDVAWFADSAVTREAAVQTVRAALVANRYDGQITKVDLVTVSGPGTIRLGWQPRDHPLAYAIQWSGGTSIGLMLVSARTGEILLVTAS